MVEPRYNNTPLDRRFLMISSDSVIVDTVEFDNSPLSNITNVVLEIA